MTTQAERDQLAAYRQKLLSALDELYRIDERREQLRRDIEGHRQTIATLVFCDEAENKERPAEAPPVTP